MTKNQIKRMIKQQLTDISDASCNVTMNQWIRSKAIYEIKEMINWRKSPYGSFSRFCEDELPQRTPTLWVSDAASYRAGILLGYTDKQIMDVAKYHPYSRLAKFFKTSKKKLTVPQLKKANLPTAGVVKRTKKPSNQFCLNLSADYFNKLVALLEPYGLVVTNNSKMNASAAMEAYLDTL